jgi:hypothetical protein
MCENTECEGTVSRAQCEAIHYEGVVPQYTPALEHRCLGTLLLWLVGAPSLTPQKLLECMLLSGSDDSLMLGSPGLSSRS